MWDIKPMLPEMLCKCYKRLGFLIIWAINTNNLFKLTSKPVIFAIRASLWQGCDFYSIFVGPFGKQSSEYICMI